ncbi:MAG: hypothetical protein ABI182_03410 [Candidatus Baltobacteraceae bacterium]
MKRATESMPIALPMVDRLVPETISPDRFRGPDRGRALSAAALSAEMSGEQERADALISQAGDNVRDQFDRRDLSCAFEVAQNRFFISRCRGDLHGMRVGVRSMARLCDRLSAAARVKFALDCSEVCLYEGRLLDARSELDFALLGISSGEGTLLRSITLVRQAQIALARRDFKVAEETAEAATQMANAHADIRVYATEVLGRSSLHSGSRWSSNGLEECQSAFHALNVRTVLARHQLKRGNLDAACEMAKDSYDDAMQLRYWNLASRSASTLAMCLPSTESRAWVAQALRLYLISAQPNAYLGDDLFDVDPSNSQRLRSYLYSEEAVALMGTIYLARCPDSVLELGTDSLLARITLFILRGTLDPQNAPSCDLFTAAAKQCSRQSIGLQEMDREIRRLSRLLRTLSILFPFQQRDDVIAANRRQTHRALHAVRRSSARHHWMALRSS